MGIFFDDKPWPPDPLEELEQMYQVGPEEQEAGEVQWVRTIEWPRREGGQP